MTEFNWPVVKLGEYGPWYNIRGRTVGILPNSEEDEPQPTFNRKPIALTPDQMAAAAAASIVAKARHDLRTTKLVLID